MSRQASPLALLIMIAMASPLALNAFIPAMPDTAVSLGTDTTAIQLTLTLYLLMLAVGQLIAGPVADIYGRRPVLLAGLCLHFSGCALGAVATDIEMLIGARILQALGGSAGMVLARTMLLDVYGKQAGAARLGYIVMAIACAQTLAPAAGGYLNLWFGWQSIFWFSSVMALPVALLAFVYLPETLHQPNGSKARFSFPELLTAYKTTLRSPGYLVYAASTTSLACAFYLFAGSMPYIVQNQLGGSSADFGQWFVLVSLAFMLGGFLSSRLNAYFQPERLILIGLSISVCGAFALLISGTGFPLSFIGLFLPMTLFMVGRGLSQPNAQSSAISCVPTQAGTASGLLGFIQLVAGAAVAQSIPFMLSTENDSNLLSILTVITLLPLGAWILQYCYRRGH